LADVGKRQVPLDLLARPIPTEGTLSRPMWKHIRDDEGIDEIRARMRFACGAVLPIAM
jgi:hypothetical protein